MERGRRDEELFQVEKNAPANSNSNLPPQVAKPGQPIIKEAKISAHAV